MQNETVIKLKRGSIDSISRYTGAVKGEPVYNFETRKLYICSNDIGTLIPVDAKYSKGYEYICSGTQSIFGSPSYPNTEVLVYVNQSLLDLSEYVVSGDTIILNTPAQINDVVNIEVVPLLTEESHVIIAGSNQTLFSLPEPLPAGSTIQVYVDNVLIQDSEYTFDEINNVTFNTAPPEGSQVKINSFEPLDVVWIGLDRDFTANTNKKYIVNTSVLPLTVTLPATANNGETISFSDGHDFSINNLNINGNGNLIEGLNEDLTIGIKYVSFNLTFYDNNWILTYVQSAVGNLRETDLWIEIINNNYNCLIDYKYIVNTESFPLTVILPATANNGETISFSDGHDFSINNLTIDRNGNLIEGLNEDLTIAIKYVSFDLTFYDNNWILTYVQSAVGNLSESNLWIEILNNNYNCMVNHKYIVNTASSPLTIILPSTANNGESIKFSDGHDFSINNLTINRNGNPIEGMNEDLTIGINNSMFELTFYNNDWILTAS